MSQEYLAQILAYYRDLGIKEIYCPEPVVAADSEPAAAPEPAAPQVEVPGLFEAELPGLAPANDSLERIREDIGDCRRCRLCEGRTKIVFGSGDPKASLVFVGEGPGEDEDLQGLPFVGRAGQLLTAMIDNTAKKEGIPITRAEVYICNVVKCRPPKNRTPIRVPVVP